MVTPAYFPGTKDNTKTSRFNNDTFLNVFNLSQIMDSGMIYSLFGYVDASEMGYRSLTKNNNGSDAKTYSLMTRPFSLKLTLKLPSALLAFFICSAALIFAQTADAQWVS